MLNADWPTVIVVLLCFCSQHIFVFLLNLFNLFNLEREWSDAKTLQLIELYEKRPCLCDKVAACNWTIAAYATLSCDFVAHSRDKIAEKIGGVTSVLQ